MPSIAMHASHSMTGSIAHLTIKMECAVPGQTQEVPAVPNIEIAAPQPASTGQIISTTWSAASITIHAGQILTPPSPMIPSWTRDILRTPISSWRGRHRSRSQLEPEWEIIRGAHTLSRNHSARLASFSKSYKTSMSRSTTSRGANLSINLDRGPHGLALC